MAEICIRPAAPEDCGLIHDLLHELAVYEKIEDIMVATPADYERHFFGERPAAEALVAELDSVPVGCAVYFHNFSTFAGRPGLYLEDVYVRPEARGKGVGGAVLRHLAGLAEERGCGRFEWTVLDWNEGAIRFYERLGAKVLPEWRIARMDREGIRSLAKED